MDPFLDTEINVSSLQIKTTNAMLKNAKITKKKDNSSFKQRKQKGKKSKEISKGQLEFYYCQ